MKTINFGDSSVPALGFGTYQLQGAEAKEMVRSAIDIGYRHIDTAQMYENEAEVGSAIRESGVAREEIFLTTKVWVSHFAYDDLLSSVQESLRRLGLDYIDLLLLHWPSKEVPLSETLSALATARQHQWCKEIGVSNFNSTLLKESVELCSAPLRCNQVEYHPFLNQQKLKQTADSLDIALTAYSPLARGGIFNDKVLTRIAQKHDKNEAQITLRWLLDQDGVLAIPKSSKLAHAKSNFEIFDFSLDDEDSAAIDQLTESNRRLIDPDGLAPTWD